MHLYTKNRYMRIFKRIVLFFIVSAGILACGKGWSLRSQSGRTVHRAVVSASGKRFLPHISSIRNVRKRTDHEPMIHTRRQGSPGKTALYVRMQMDAMVLSEDLADLFVPAIHTLSTTAAERGDERHVVGDGLLVLALSVCGERMA